MSVTVINKEQYTTYYSILKRNFQRNTYTHYFVLNVLIKPLHQLQLCSPMSLKMIKNVTFTPVYFVTPSVKLQAQINA